MWSGFSSHTQVVLDIYALGIGYVDTLLPIFVDDVILELDVLRIDNINSK